MARALYIHWPFCLAKCPYCDFNSHVRDSIDVEKWQESLLSDLRHEAGLAGTEALESVFFGGGTPSLMPPELVETLLAEAEKLWGFAPDIEITLEANPSSVETGKFKDLAAAGVNRVSLGLQSLDDHALRFLGRLHDAKEGLEALKTAHNWFNRVSFDLIYALPGQDIRLWRKQLSDALTFGTSHLSLYQLTIEPGTRFETLVRQGAFTPLEDDAAADLFALTRELTANAGLPAYEVSNHARPGEESRHNLTYWRYQDYVGVGPGAHGRRNGLATIRHRKPENWLSAVGDTGHGISSEQALAFRDQAAEAMLMGLRLAEGVDVEALGARLAMPTRQLVDEAKLAFLVSEDLAWQREGRIGVTERGIPVLDNLIALLVPGELLAA